MSAARQVRISDSGRRLSKLFLLLSLVLLLSLCSVFYSSTALQLLSRLIPEQSPLQLGQVEGSLASGFKLKDLTFNQGAMQLQIASLETKVRWYCLAHLEICLETAQVQDMQLVLTPTDHQAGQPDTAVMQLPSIRIDQLQVNRLQVQLDQTKLSLAELNTSVHMSGQQLAVGDSVLRQLALHLPKTAATPPPQTAAKNAAYWWQYAQPSFSGMKLPFALQLPKLTVHHLQLSGAQSVSAQKLRLSLNAGPQQLKLSTLQISQLQLEQNQLALPPLELQAQLQLSNSAPYELQGFVKAQSADLTLDSSLSGSLTELQLQLELAGSQQASATVQISPLTAGLPLQLQLQASQLHWPLQGHPLYQLRDLQLQSQGSLADLQFSLTSQQQLPQLTQSQLQLNAHWQAPLLHWSTLKLNSDSGQLHSTGSLDLSKELALSATLQLQQVQLDPWFKDYPGSVTGELTVNASYHQQQWQLELPRLAMSGQLRQQPLSLSGQLQARGKALDVQALSSKTLLIQHGANSIKAEGEVTEQWRMALAIAAPELASSIQGAQGSLVAQVRLSGPQKKPDLDVELRAEKLRYKKLLRVQSANLNAKVSSASLNHQLELNLGKGTAYGQKVNSAQILMTGNNVQSDVVVQLDSEDYKAQLQATAAAQAKQQWQLQVQQAQLQTPIGHWALQDPLKMNLDWPKQQLTIPAHCWHSDPGQLCLQKTSRLSQTQADIAVQLRQFHLALLQSFISESQQLAGEVNADLQLSWNQKQGVNAALGLTGTAGQWRQTDVNPLRLPWQSWTAQLQLSPKTLTSHWVMQLSEQSSVSASFNLPDLRMQDKKLEAELGLRSIDLSFLRTLMPDQSEFVASLNGQVRASGTLAKPLLSGQIKVTDIKLQGNNAPLDIQQGSMQLDFLQQKALLTAQIQSGEGKAQLSGYADWFDLNNYQARLALSGQQLPLSLPQGLIYVEPEITLLAQNKVVAVQGTVQIPAADIAIDDLPQNAVQISDDEILLNKDLEVRRAATPSDLKLLTEMRLVLGDQVKLQAFGLKSRLKGQLLYSQNDAQQRLTGEVNILDGTFRSYGQDLLIRKGKLMFTGPVDQPFLTIEAIRNPASTEDDVIAGIRVNGPADQASIVIFSEPSKPQANALSYLLMGRDLSSSADSRSNPLTSGLIGLGIANSNGLVSQLGQAFGVEQFTLDTAGTGDDSQVTVSGYLSPKLQLKYGVGIFNSLGEFTLRYELMRNLYLEAVQGLDSAVDVLYKFEFD